MASHSSSPPRPQALGNGLTRSNNEVGRSTQVTQPHAFVSNEANAFYSGDRALDPQLSGASVSDAFGYFGYRGNVTFGAGFGAESNNNHIEIPGDDGRSYTVPASDTPTLDLDAMSRFEKGPDPVSFIGQSVEGMRGWRTTSQIIPRPQDAYTGYRNGPASDMDTSYTHQSHARNDSGYVTRSFNESDHISHNGEDARSIIRQVGSLNFDPNMPLNMAFPEVVVDQDSKAPADNHGQHRCPEPECPENKLMNRSEYRKHMHRHEKPFKCSVHNCKRSIDGFATQNDLARHTKSVHNELSASANERSFICKGERCAHRSKIWPRLDNFKAHCKRRHGAEDLDDLVRRSAIDSRTQKSFVDGSKMACPTEVSDSHSSIECVGRNGEPQLVQPAVAPSMESFRSTNDNMLGIAPLKVSPQTGQASGRAMGTSLHTELPKSTTGDSVMQSYPSHGQHDPLAEIAAVDFTQPSPRSWSGDLDELERYLVTDFTAAQDRGWEPTANELGAIAKARILSFLKTPRKRRAFEADLDDSDGAGRKQDAPAENNAPLQPRTVKCSVCDKVMSRLCDLKKHQKRHSRPWGCTDAKCNKTFGSKNDWKRHENSQHYQLETWRCSEPSGTSLIGVCAKIFFRQDPFRAHLRKEHGIGTDNYIRDQCRQRRIGRNWQDRFWCGFCKDIVKLQQKGLQAWDERFNHIDDCHFKKGQSIDDWYPLDKDLPKGKLRRERNLRLREAPEGRDSSQLHEDHEELSDPTDEEPGPRSSHASPPPPPPPPPPPVSRELTVWSSPSRSFSEEKAAAATELAPHQLPASESQKSSGELDQSGSPIHKDSFTTDSRQTSIEMDMDSKTQNARMCWSCRTPVNPEIDISCPMCEARIGSRVTEDTLTGS